MRPLQQLCFGRQSRLSSRAAAPTAVFALPVVEDQRSSANASIEARAGDAEKRTPTKPRICKAGGGELSACCPSAVFNPGYPPSGGGTSARVCGANAKHTRMSGMRRNPRHNGSERAGSRPHETNLLT